MRFGNVLGFVTTLSQERPEKAEELKPGGTITAWSLLGWLVALSVVAVAVGYATGVISAPHGYFWIEPRGASPGEFDWGNAMLGATAAGTVRLAAFTAALAYTTSGDVSATWRLAQATIERPGCS